MMDRQQGLAGVHYHGGEYQHDGDPVARESLNEVDVDQGRKDLNILEADQGREEELTNLVVFHPPSNNCPTTGELVVADNNNNNNEQVQVGIMHYAMHCKVMIRND